MVGQSHQLAFEFTSQLTGAVKNNSGEKAEEENIESKGFSVTTGHKASTTEFKDQTEKSRKHPKREVGQAQTEGRDTGAGGKRGNRGEAVGWGKGRN